MVPEGYDLATFFEAIEPYNDIINHNKYNNNYGYNRSIYLVGSEQHLDNNFLILREDEACRRLWLCCFMSVMMICHQPKKK
jgi:hypothetical protein